MKQQHEVWDARAKAQLDRFRLHVSHVQTGVEQEHIDAVTAAIQRNGFVLLNGLCKSVDRDTCAKSLPEFFGQLGTIVPQSPLGQQVEDVRDFSDIDERDDRGYRSRGELTPHTDPPTLIVLHCLQQAKQGGESALVNVHAVHDLIEAIDPALLAILYEDFPQWRVAGAYGQVDAGPSPATAPVFANLDERVSCLVYRPFIEQAAAALDQPLTAEQVAALDLFDQCTNDPSLSLRFDLQVGETLVIHNRSVLHARTDYEDWPQPERRRHLLRLWIDAPETFAVASVHEKGNMFES